MKTDLKRTWIVSGTAKSIIYESKILFHEVLIIKLQKQKTVSVLKGSLTCVTLCS